MKIKICVDCGKNLNNKQIERWKYSDRGLCEQCEDFLISQAQTYMETGF